MRSLLGQFIRQLNYVTTVAAVASLTGCASLERAPERATAIAPPLSAAVPTHSAVRPEPRDAKWMERHAGFVRESRERRIDVLFVGDSITDFWRDENPQRGGRRVWDRDFAPLDAANFGISADRTQHVLWRLQNGEIDAIKPRVVVLLIGTNNTGLERDKITPRNTPAETVEGITAVVREIRTRLPAAKIVLHALFPRGENPDHPQRAQIAAINREIARSADGKTIRFLDLGSQFLQPDGTLIRDLMPDYLHPSEKGYEVWAAALKPVLLEMLGHSRVKRGRSK